jgi:UDP-GlcNAc:undecaprenyl-phosphate/decaprenyl-phosphate GlcNAc-1-phosphate transferase
VIPLDIQIILAFLGALLTSLLITPLVIKIAHLIGVVDKPNARKVHAKVMPRLGGLAIFAGVVAGYFIGGLYNEKITGITVGALIIMVVGILDDKYELSAKVKLMGQLLSAAAVVGSGLTVDIITIPFVGTFELGLWTYPITVFWIIAITNAINLIDGLDGLSAGISSIVISTIAVMAGFAGKSLILMLCVILLGSTLGFLYHNFYPAKIFMGDTGALFLGYSISVVSLLGLYKSVTLFSFVVPVIILGVPIFDTTYAIIRRLVNKKPISAPDKSHLHHRLLALGLSHRQTVLCIYGFGLLFSLSAILFSTTTLWGSLIIIAALLFIAELLAELIGLVSDKHKPFINFFRKVKGRS